MPNVGQLQVTCVGPFFFNSFYFYFSLHDKGGWQDDFIIEKFKEYAKFCFDHFGDRVKMWITINEPHVVAAFGYGSGIHAPGVQGQVLS